MIKIVVFSFLFALLSSINVTSQTKWQLADNGEIIWLVDNNIPHYDHIEMSGKQVSVVVRYGVDEQGAFVCERSMVFPMLRTIPNNTHASLMHRFAVDMIKLITVNGLIPSQERVNSISINGNVFVKSNFTFGGRNIGSGSSARVRMPLEITREILPSAELPALIERYTLKNGSERPVTVIIPTVNDVYVTDPDKGVDGAYVLEVKSVNPGCYILEPGSNAIEFGLTIEARRLTETSAIIDVTENAHKRYAFVHDTIGRTLILKTPDPVINKMFEFAKIRACESIYKTKGGYMHGPGGESYYAAIWANDQAEYINPFFPFVKYETGNLSAMNSFRHFARFMNPDFKPVPSSIIAEGIDIWAGAGDRGDAAMIAYGAGRYALARGNINEAKELWPLIKWCLEYCKKNLNEHGVVNSDTDELEGRFPAGRANLCTSSLYYDALLSATYLGRELGVSKKETDHYSREAAAMRKAIESWFGSDDLGFHTYRYFEGNDLLRSWICIPLVMGINDRASGTVEALFSPRLWSDNGLLTQEGSATYWDRSTLYGLRGVFASGYTEKATEYLIKYSTNRLLGEHVPYAIEAYPEGSQRHLSAESALYCRIITEGLMGIRPTGFRSFDMAVRLPERWDNISLHSIAAFGLCFDIDQVRLPDGRIKVVVSTQDGKIHQEYVRKIGEKISVELKK